MTVGSGRQPAAGRLTRGRALELSERLVIYQCSCRRGDAAPAELPAPWSAGRTARAGGASSSWPEKSIPSVSSALLPAFVLSRIRSPEGGRRPLPSADRRRGTMRRAVLLIGLLSTLSGCTHVALQKDTVRTTSTLADLQHQQ